MKDRISICSACADASHTGIKDDDPTFKVDDSTPCGAYECVLISNSLTNNQKAMLIAIIEASREIGRTALGDAFQVERIGMMAGLNRRRQARSVATWLDRKGLTTTYGSGIPLIELEPAGYEIAIVLHNQHHNHTD